MNHLPPSVQMLAARYKTNRAAVVRYACEAHDLASLASRVMLSTVEVLEFVERGELISLGSANGKHLFSSRSLDGLRNRVVSFIAEEIVTAMEERGADEERTLHALSRAFQRQHELSRRAADVVNFARTPADDDDDDFYDQAKRAAATTAGIGASAGAGYLGYRAYQALKNRGNGGEGGNALPGGSQPQLPPGPSPSGDSMGARHPGPPAGASISRSITTASPTTTPKATLGTNIIDPLSQAVSAGRKAIARRGAGLLGILRNIPLE